MMAVLFAWRVNGEKILHRWLLLFSWRVNGEKRCWRGEHVGVAGVVRVVLCL